MGHALLFVLGFSFVFVVVIGGLAGALSELLQENRDVIRNVMGVMLIVFGLHMLGVINIPFLNYTRRLEVKPSSNFGYLRSLLIGVGFGAGWTPCIGPTLGLIFTLAVNGDQAAAFPLFLAYSLGMGVPFLLAALAMGQVTAGLKKLTRRMFSLKMGSWTVIDQVNIVSLVSGGLLVIMGILILANMLTWLNQFAPTFGI
jgi:cytochrome c-type biogenesis protein